MTDSLFKYISGKDLMDRWGADLAKMRQLCNGTLQAYRERQHEPLRQGEAPDCYGGFAPGFISPESDWTKSPSQSFCDSFYRMPREEQIRYPKAQYTSLEKCSPYYEEDMHVAVFLLEKIEKIEKIEDDHPDEINQSLTKKDAQQQIQPPNGIVVDGSAPEQLRVAAEAWEALYKSSEYLKWKKGPKTHITEWIEEKYPERFSLKAKDRIAIIINHKPQGGLPPT